MKNPTTEAILRKLRKMSEDMEKWTGQGRVSINILGDGSGEFQHIGWKIPDSQFSSLPEAMKVANRLMRGK